MLLKTQHDTTDPVKKECGVCYESSDSWVSTSDKCAHEVCTACYATMSGGVIAARVAANIARGWHSEIEDRCSACGAFGTCLVFGTPSPFSRNDPFLKMCVSCYCASAQNRPKCPFCRA